MKRTYQPKNRQEKKEHGFMKRMKTSALKGRYSEPFSITIVKN